MSGVEVTIQDRILTYLTRTERLVELHFCLSSISLATPSHTDEDCLYLFKPFIIVIIFEY